MCSASRPERGVGWEDGVKEDEVTEESAGWMMLAFAAIADRIRGDQEKWVRIGDLMSEGHISRSLDESPNNLNPNQLIIQRTRTRIDIQVIENMARLLLHLNAPVLCAFEQVEPCLEDCRSRCAR